MQADIDIFRTQRSLILKVVQKLSHKQLLTVPDKMPNNIAWNLGHIIYVQNSLVYRLARLDLALPETYRPLFSPGTAPADWQTQPDIDEMLTLFEEQSLKQIADFEAGVFNNINYRSYATTTGFQLSSIEHGIAFNNFHDGLHFGWILAIIDAL